MLIDGQILLLTPMEVINDQVPSYFPKSNFDIFLSMLSESYYHLDVCTQNDILLLSSNEKELSASWTYQNEISRDHFVI